MKLFLAISSLVSFVCSAPLTQYLIYTPSALPHLIKYQPEIIQSTSPLKLENGKQVFYYYPSPSLAPTFAPYQVVVLRDDGDTSSEPDWWQGLQNWFSQWGQGANPGQGSNPGSSPAAPTESAAPPMKLVQRLDNMDKTEMKVQEIMNKDDKKIFLVSGPQFFGNYGSLGAPLYTTFPFGTIVARSKDADAAVEQPSVSVVESPTVKAVVNPEVQPIIVAEPQAVHVAPQGRSSFDDQEIIMDTQKDDMEKKEEMIEESKMEETKAEEKIPEGKEYDDVASAEPVAIVLDGKDALAPISTSFVGPASIPSDFPIEEVVEGKKE